jgi:hypothetical protein
LSPYTSFFEGAEIIHHFIGDYSHSPHIFSNGEPSSHGHPNIIGPDARYEKKLYFLAFTCKYAKTKVMKE